MTGSSRPSAVFDCMVFLQGAARKECPAGLCLALAQVGAIELFVSDSIIAEVRDVMTRPVSQDKLSVLTAAFVDEWLSALRAISTHVPHVAHAFSYQRDPKDEPYLDLALAQCADYLVTRDSDLLDLADPRNPEGDRLRKLHQRLAIVDPVKFLRAVLAGQPSGSNLAFPEGIREMLDASGIDANHVVSPANVGPALPATVGARQPNEHTFLLPVHC